MRSHPRPSPAQVLDHDQLCRLCGELGDRRALERFLDTFLELLPSRLLDLTEEVRHGRQRPCEVAVNLAAISQMIGAQRLASHLRRLHGGDVEEWTSPIRERFLDEAVAEASYLRRALVRYLALPPGAWVGSQTEPTRPDGPIERTGSTGPAGPIGGRGRRTRDSLLVSEFLNAGGIEEGEETTRWRRIHRRVSVASARGDQASADSLVLELTEALLVAHDLYMLGEIDRAPALHWDTADAEAVLRPWAVRVVPDAPANPGRQLPG